MEGEIFYPPGFTSQDTSNEKAKSIPPLSLGVPKLTWSFSLQKRTATFRSRDLSGLIVHHRNGELCCEPDKKESFYDQYRRS
jgi:hypothetical protein